MATNRGGNANEHARESNDELKAALERWFYTYEERVELGATAYGQPNVALVVNPTPGFPDGVALFTITQHQIGSADFKVFWMVDRCQRSRMPSLLVMFGNGFSQESTEYAQRTADGRHFVAAIPFAALRDWLKFGPKESR